jgi:hypothetical protein
MLVNAINVLDLNRWMLALTMVTSQSGAHGLLSVQKIDKASIRQSAARQHFHIIQRFSEFLHEFLHHHPTGLDAIHQPYSLAYEIGH